MPTPTEGRIARANRIRPAIRRMADATSYREIEELSGVNRTTINDMVEKGAVPSEKNLARLEAVADNLADFGEPKEELANPGPSSLLQSLWLRIDAIRIDPSLGPIERAIREEVELSAYRTAVHEMEARTASERVRAIREEAEASALRNEIVRPGFDSLPTMPQESAPPRNATRKREAV